MYALDINRHLNGLIDDLPEDTVDRVIYGAADAEVEGIAVAWMPYRETIERARNLGANVLVTHEPTFYDHRDLGGRLKDLPAVRDKQRFIEAQGMTIIRCHDVWDALPEIGIPFAWGDYLELGPLAGGERYYNLYAIEPQPASQVARRIARKAAILGQPTVGFYGDAGRMVKTVGLGTGCISDPFHLYEMGADLAISVDDVVRAWVAGEWCQDTGHPLVVVNHCVSEEPGMMTLAAHLAETFPGVPVHHIPQQCTYQSVTASP